MPNDFVLAPDYVFEEKPSYNTLVTKFENGFEQRRPKRASAITEYVLEYRNRTTSERDTILNLFNARKGSYSSFTWTHPITSETKTVRFKEDSLSVINKAYGVHDISFTLIEVL